jgi:predicted metalloprotease with PDZ domain
MKSILVLAPLACALAAGAQNLTLSAAPQQSVVYSNDRGLGAGLADLTDQSAKDLKLKNLNGVQVSDIAAGGPAATAGIQPQDVVVAFNGQPVFSVRELQRMIAETPAGRTVPLELVRAGKTATVSVHLNPALPTPAALKTLTFAGANNASVDNLLAQAAGAIAADPSQAAALKSLRDALAQAEASFNDAQSKFGVDNPTSLDAQRRLILAEQQLRVSMNELESSKVRVKALAAMAMPVNGVDIENLTPQLASYFGLKDGQTGLLVRSVAPASAAGKAGLHAGDIVVKVNNEPISTPPLPAFNRLFSTRQGQGVSLDVLRKGEPVHIDVPPATTQPEGQ